MVMRARASARGARSAVAQAPLFGPGIKAAPLLPQLEAVMRGWNLVVDAARRMKCRRVVRRHKFAAPDEITVGAKKIEPIFPHGCSHRMSAAKTYNQARAVRLPCAGNTAPHEYAQRC